MTPLKQLFTPMPRSRLLPRYFLLTGFLRLIALAILNPLFSQFDIDVSKVGTTSAPFLEIEVGSKAVGEVDPKNWTVA